MQYFIFKPAAGTPETGPQYPQVQKLKQGYNFKAPNSVHALSRETKKIPDYEPDFDYFVLHNQAKLTDILSVAPISGGFLISEKLKNIFQQFKLPLHRFYPVKVAHKNNYYDYYWMHIICDLTNSVDYPKSTFFVYKDFTHSLGTITIESKDDLLAKKKKLKDDNPGKTVTIWADKIAFTDSFDKRMDLFEVGAFDANYYISDTLQQTLVDEKVTGYEALITEKIIT